MIWIPCTQGDRCISGLCQSGSEGKDTDADGFVDQACPGGNDCDDDPTACGENCHPGVAENLDEGQSCTDTYDNDCDGKRDDQDSGCQICGLDEDCHDNNVCTDEHCEAGQCVSSYNEKDCDDGDACTQGDFCSLGICQSGDQPKDEDQDGYVDQACTGGNDCDDDPLFCGAQCYPQEEEVEGTNDTRLCLDGFDNDCDGLTDGQDPDCAGCGSDAQCDDNNVCTDDVCQEGSCMTSPNTNRCDDGDACTQHDMCFAGTCLGYNTCSDHCDESCSDGCWETGCCIQECPGDACPSCQAGCSCDQVCDKNSCKLTCLEDSVCHLNAISGDASSLACQDAVCFFECDKVAQCTMHCAGESLCDMFCNFGGLCTLQCADEASCKIECNKVGNCVLANCTNPTSCGNGIQVCGMDCP